MVNTKDRIGRHRPLFPPNRFIHGQTDLKICHWAGCELEGEFRAPKSRSELKDYLWFCLEHVRLYNASWNYYEGMSDDEVESDRRNDVTWNRPTKQFGGNHVFKGEQVDDPLGIYQENIASLNPQNGSNTPGNPRPRPHSDEELALSMLDLIWPITVKKLKSQYKKLVKVHHPDANQGDKQAEERFKTISDAYSKLLSYLEQEKV